MKLEIKKDIYEEIHELLSKARQNIILNVNSTMTKTYFLIGKRKDLRRNRIRDGCLEI